MYANEDHSTVSPGFALKKYLKEEIEKQLNEEFQDKKERGEVDKESTTMKDVKIADITFAFDNSELIALLRERGGYINTQKYDKMREAEAKISELKNEQYETLTRPVCAFITFEEEDGYILAQDFEPTRRENLRQLLGKNMVFVEAQEPTNIIWENRHFTKNQRLTRIGIAAAINLVLVAISFVIIYYIQFAGLKMTSQYPEVNCDAIESSYGDTLEMYAFEEYNLFNTDGLDYYLTGSLQCFCYAQGWTGLGLVDFGDYTHPETGETE